MRRMTRILLTVAIVFACSPIVAATQDQSSFDKRALNFQMERALPHGFQYEGSTTCAQCHVAPQTKNILDAVMDFVSLNEYRTWLTEDPHSRSYLAIIPEKEHFEAVRARFLNLNRVVERATGNGDHSGPSSVALPEWGASNERSQQILKKMFAENYSQAIGDLLREITEVQSLAGKRLKYEQLAGFTPRLRETLQQCLSCHAGWDNSREVFDYEIIKYGTGISCESCHGPSSHWLELHSKSDWRTAAPHRKEVEFGMTDVRNPISRAEQCYSCHIGNVRQGKVVTHEMYAAGHPPLPGIEIESFADQMPRHWRYLSEKRPDFEFAGEFTKHFGHGLATDESFAWTSDEFPRTKNLLVAGVMASAYSVELLVRLSNNEQIEWPEFAAFDCAACHHDLKANGGWQRQFAGIPGRPPAPYWPRALAKLGAAHLDLQSDEKWSERLAAEQQRLQSVLDRQPFGIPADLKKQTSQYSGWLRSELANALQIEPLDQEDAKAVLQLLVGSNVAIFDPQKEIRDFHSARQLAWAINVVYSEILQAQQGSRNNGERQINHHLVGETMSEQLMLGLPDTGEITNEQSHYLEKWRDFDREEFLGQLKLLQEALNVEAQSGSESP